MNNLDLFPHEHEALCAALRRDMRREEERAGTDPVWAEFHRLNARHDRHLLETLNPRDLAARDRWARALTALQTGIFAGTDS